MQTNPKSLLDGVPLRNLKCGMPGGESPRQKLTPAGALVEMAMKRAGLEPKQLADAMGVSPSFLQRGFKDQEHISWQRLQMGSCRFRRELLAVQAEDLDGVRLRTVIEIEGEREIA